jgi:D-3-phosphoglycerate dehydrogenase
MTKILITPRSFRESGEAPLRFLREKGFEIVENSTGKTLDEAQMCALCADIEGLVVGIDPVTRKVLESAPKLRAISKYGAGLDNVDLVAAAERGVQVRAAVGTNARSVAELAIGLMFAMARHLVPAGATTKAGGWGRTRGVELQGRTLGILGLGSIGREVAKMAHGLGMQVLAYDPVVEPTAPFLVEHGIQLADRAEVIRGADFLTLHLPLLDSTRSMMDAVTLATMKPTAVLINTSRGELVDEAALLDALTNRRLGGAASDVFSKEPPAADHPLLKLDNFLLTPHIGAYTLEANRRMAEVSAANLAEMLETGP